MNRANKTTCQFEIKSNQNLICFSEKNWFSENNRPLAYPAKIVKWLNLNSPLCDFGHYAIRSWKGLILCIHQPVYPAYDGNLVFLLNGRSFDRKGIVFIQPSAFNVLKVQFFDMDGTLLYPEYQTRARERRKGIKFQQTDFYAELVFIALHYQNRLSIAGKDWKLYHSCISENFRSLKIEEAK